MPQLTFNGFIVVITTTCSLSGKNLVNHTYNEQIILKRSICDRQISHSIKICFKVTAFHSIYQAFMNTKPTSSLVHNPHMGALHFSFTLANWVLNCCFFFKNIIYSDLFCKLFFSKCFKKILELIF